MKKRSIAYAIILFCLSLGAVNEEIVSHVCERPSPPKTHKITSPSDDFPGLPVVSEISCVITSLVVLQESTSAQNNDTRDCADNLKLAFL